MNYYCGIDIGSTYTKVVLTAQEKIVGKSIFKTEVGFNEKIASVINKLSGDAGISTGTIKRTGVTGYGRKNCEIADFSATEIRAIAKGIHYIAPDVRTILDIGGQDYKIIQLNNAGSVVEFQINDKCASGTGRFIELMAIRLNLTLNQLSGMDLSEAKNQGLSSTCAVFADAEVIKLIAENKKLADIVYSVYMTIKRRILSSLQVLEGTIALTGGVSQNESFVFVLKSFYPALCRYDISDVIGAYGMALLASEGDMPAKSR